MQRRLASINHAPPAPATNASPASLLAGITEALDKLTPRFDINANDIEIIRSPIDFYETLKTKIKHARHRVFLSTLYVGKTEQELVRSLFI